MLRRAELRWFYDEFGSKPRFDYESFLNAIGCPRTIVLDSSKSIVSSTILKLALVLANAGSAPLLNVLSDTPDPPT